MAAVSVVEDANGVASLHINNRQQEGSSATLFADARQALLPVLLHPARRALFLGLALASPPRSPKIRNWRSMPSNCCRKSSTHRRISPT